MNTSPEAAPKLPKLPFLAADAFLLLTALFVGICSGTPLDAASVIAIALLTGGGTALALVPFWADFVRKQELAAHARQRELDTLARDTALATARVDAAVTSLHALAENAHRASLASEQLPQQLQGILQQAARQIDEQAAQTRAAVENRELETLREEAARLRAADSVQLEKLQTLLEKITAASTAATETFASASGIAAETTRSADATLATVTAALARLDETATRLRTSNEEDRTQLKAALQTGLQDAVSQSSAAAKAAAEAAAEATAERTQATLRVLDESAQQLRTAADALAGAAATLAAVAATPAALPPPPPVASSAVTPDAGAADESETTPAVPPVTVPGATGNGSAATRTRLGRGLRSLIAGATPESVPAVAETEAAPAAEADADSADKPAKPAKSTKTPRSKTGTTTPPVSVPEPAPEPVADAPAAPEISDPQPALGPDSDETAEKVADPAPVPPSAPAASPEPEPDPTLAALEAEIAAELAVDPAHILPPIPAPAAPVPATPLPPPPPASVPTRRAAKPAIVKEDTTPGLFDDPAFHEEPSESSRSISSDGATRLIATAYIGIGNKLYIRGEGPGLRPDKGVPLQFVSIGKWRWETTDATTSLRVRLYKNDQIECTTTGEIELIPGHQHEVSATF